MPQRSQFLIPWLLTALSVAAMCGLGFWQLERMVGKQQRLASIAQKQSNESLSLIDALSQEDPRDISISFVGTPDSKRALLLDNQIHEQQVGFDVFAPVSTNAGWILVNYGWIAAPDLQRTIPEVNLPSGSNKFEGVITVPGSNPLIKETNVNFSQFPALIQQVAFATLSQSLNIKLLPYVVELTSQDSAFVRDYKPVVMPPEKHLGYAVQWFGLAIAAAAIGGFAISKKGRIHE